MAILNWPTTGPFVPQRFTWGGVASRSAFSGFLTGETQSVSHLADRHRAQITLPPCSPADAGLREAFVTQLVLRGDLVRMWHLQRPVPLGTLAGSPTVAAGAAAGAVSLQVQSVAGATLAGGDLLGLATGQLVQVGMDGAVANGSGVLTVPLVHALRTAVAGTSAVTWYRPVALWQIATTTADFAYGRAAWQAPVEVSLAEVY